MQKLLCRKCFGEHLSSFKTFSCGFVDCETSYQAPIGRSTSQALKRSPARHYLLVHGPPSKQYPLEHCEVGDAEELLNKYDLARHFQVMHGAVDLATEYCRVSPYEGDMQLRR